MTTMLISIVLALLMATSRVEAQWLNETWMDDPHEPVFFPRIWLGIIEVGLNSLEKARNNETLTKCEIQLGMYAGGLANKVPWAIEMYDSTGKQGPGLLRGRVTWHGDYQQCITLTHPLPASNEMLRGHYCSTMFEVPKWLISVIQKKELPFDVHLPALTVDLCVPSACNENDIEAITEDYIMRNSNTTHMLHAVNCHRKLNIADDPAAIISASVVTLIILCVLLGTSIDAFLAITTPDVDEQAEMPIGFHKRAASLLSRAGSMLSRRGSTFSLQDGKLKKRGSIFSRRPNVYKTQVSYISNHSKDIAIETELEIPAEKKSPKEQHSPRQRNRPKEQNTPKEQNGSTRGSVDLSLKDVLGYSPKEQHNPKEQNGSTRGSVDLSLKEVKGVIANGSSSPTLSRSSSVGSSALKAKKPVESSVSKVSTSVELDAKGLIQRQKSLERSKKLERLKKDAYGRQTSLQSILEDNDVNYDPTSKTELPIAEPPFVDLSNISDEKFVSKKKRNIGQAIVDGFLCFSLQRNLQRILGEGNPNYLFCLNGVRVLSITWIVLGNTISFLYKEPDVVANSIQVPQIAQTFIFQIVINGTFAADTFFILSGTLLAYNWMKQDEKAQLKNPNEKFTLKKLLILYFHRFVRIAPCFYVLIMTFTNLLPYFGEGPRWKYISNTIRQCKDHWWANALFISNFYKADDMCMSWTYYLVNDFQFYLISPIVLIPLTKCPPLGYTLLILLVLTQIISTAVLNRNINGNILRMGGGYFENVYAKPYCRVGVFAIGIALGYALFKAGRRVYFRKTALIIGWCVSLCTLSVLVFITYDENRVGGTRWTATQTAVYEAISRPAWGLGVSWIIFCCCIGQGGFIEKMLSWNFFLPLCRITYGIYLLHPLLIIVIVDTSASLIYIAQGELLLLFVFVLVCAVFSALILMSFVEGPFIRLESLILK